MNNDLSRGYWCAVNFDSSALIIHQNWHVFDGWQWTFRIHSYFLPTGLGNLATWEITCVGMLHLHLFTPNKRFVASFLNGSVKLSKFRINLTPDSKSLPPNPISPRLLGFQTYHQCWRNVLQLGIFTSYVINELFLFNQCFHVFTLPRFRQWYGFSSYPVHHTQATIPLSSWKVSSAIVLLWEFDPYQVHVSTTPRNNLYR